VEYTTHEKNNKMIVEIVSLDSVIASASDFLDVIVNLPANNVIVYEHMLHKDFFDLKTGLAGEVLQKVSTYRFRLGIVGDFTKYESNSLRDFIYESNETKQVMFLDSRGTIVEEFMDT
jgi:hypothetical protein